MDSIKSVEGYEEEHITQQKIHHIHHHDGHVGDFARLLHKGIFFGALDARTQHTVDEWHNDNNDGNGAGEAVVLGAGHPEEDARLKECLKHINDHQNHGRIDNGAHHLTADYRAPQFAVFALFAGGGFVAIAGEQHIPLFGQDAFEPIVARNGAFYEKRGEKSGDHRHCHNNGIEFGIEHTQCHTGGGDNERKFTDLGEAKSRLNGNAQGLPHDQHTKSAKQNHAHNHH